MTSLQILLSVFLVLYTVTLFLITLLLCRKINMSYNELDERQHRLDEAISWMQDTQFTQTSILRDMTDAVEGLMDFHIILTSYGYPHTKEDDKKSLRKGGPEYTGKQSKNPNKGL